MSIYGYIEKQKKDLYIYIYIYREGPLEGSYISGGKAYEPSRKFKFIYNFNCADLLRFQGLALKFGWGVGVKFIFDCLW
jgi:hypothetical protein